MSNAEAKVSSLNASFTVPAWSFFVPLIAVVLLLVAAAQRPDGRLHVWVLDIGQGDAILVRTPQGNTALIDGGPGATPLLSEMGEHLPFWQRDLDLMVLTHPHQDHMMGLIDVLQRYDVDQVVQTAFTATGSLEAQWFHAVKTEGVPVHYASRGENIGFKGEPEIELRILHPLAAEATGRKQSDDINNGSVVLRLSYGKYDILLEGDAQEAAEAEMSRLPREEIASEILKVGHHGSDTSSTPHFVKGVRPRVAIISVGTDMNQLLYPRLTLTREVEDYDARAIGKQCQGTCALCEVEFIGREGKKYCSDGCKDKASYLRKKLD